MPSPALSSFNRLVGLARAQVRRNHWRFRRSRRAGLGYTLVEQSNGLCCLQMGQRSWVIEADLSLDGVAPVSVGTVQVSALSDAEKARLISEGLI